MTKGRVVAVPRLCPAKAVVGLRPSFSAHVRLGERGAPVLFPIHRLQIQEKKLRLVVSQSSWKGESLGAYEAGGEEAIAGVEAGEDPQVVVGGAVGKEPFRSAGVKRALVLQGSDLFLPGLQPKGLLAR
jgi:hypothetical protein